MATRFLAILGLLLALSACARAEPFELPRPGEIPEGPGLLSGEDGRFVIFRR